MTWVALVGLESDLVGWWTRWSWVHARVSIMYDHTKICRVYV